MKENADVRVHTRCVKKLSGSLCQRLCGEAGHGPYQCIRNVMMPFEYVNLMSFVCMYKMSQVRTVIDIVTYDST